MAESVEIQNFYDMSLGDLESWALGLGKEKFRAQQLFRWVHGLGITDFEQMTNISKAFRQDLVGKLNFELPEVKKFLRSTDGTRKLLLSVDENLSFEAVLIPSPKRLTLCVSSEVGCNLACSFCFTGKQKLKKRLSASQIVGQFILAQKYLDEGERITNIVFMGMGEPLDNPTAVFKAIEILHSPWGINFSRKKITVSTSGIVPLIPKITESGVRLAVSLNAADDETRSTIMPVNRRWNIKTLLDACREHSRIAKDKVTLEYVLLKGVTDSIADARKLYHLTKTVPCKLNIIPFNEHPGSEFLRPSEESIVAFQQELMDLGAHVLRRKTMGRDIFAACGQLTSAIKDHPERMQA